MAIFRGAFKTAAVGAVAGFLYVVVYGVAFSGPTEASVPEIDEFKARLYDLMPSATASVVDVLYKLHTLHADPAGVGMDTPQLAFVYKDQIQTTLATYVGDDDDPARKKSVEELSKDITEYVHGMAADIALDASSNVLD